MRSTQLVRDTGGQIIIRNGQYVLTDAFIPVVRLHELAIDPMIANINPIFLGVTRQEGVANNQADLVLKGQQVRSVYGLTGAGVKVGVLSDSVDQFAIGGGLKGIAGSIATGDLPPEGVDVIADSPVGGEDEGRAMLELVHDIAPDASLAFATSNYGMQAFADYIRQLHDDGSNVIVDDIGFFTESMFQPSVIDQAITDVVRDNATYFSAAGNEGTQAGLEIAPTFAKVGRNRFVDWDPNPTHVDTQMRIHVASGGTFYLEWDEPYNGIVGNAQTDLDVYIYDAKYHHQYHIGADNNLKTGIPGEFGIPIPSGDWDLEIMIADQVPGAHDPSRIRMVGFSDVRITSTEYPVLNQASIYGHAAGEDSIGVGAVPFYAPSANEDFSSNGPLTHTRDANGNKLSSPIVLQKPDISGVDDVNTSFFPFLGGTGLFGFPIDSPFDSDVLPNFAGTSAAAPNVAALAALFKQADPDATQSQIRDAFQSTATPLNGAPAGSYDPQAGFGLVNGLAAAGNFVAVPTAEIVPVKPDPTDQPVESIKIVFNQVVTGFNITDLILSRDGGTNLLSGGQTVRTTDNGRSYLLRHLSGLTDLPGTYTLTIRAELGDREQRSARAGRQRHGNLDQG